MKMILDESRTRMEPDEESRWEARVDASAAIFHQHIGEAKGDEQADYRKRFAQLISVFLHDDILAGVKEDALLEMETMLSEMGATDRELLALDREI